MKLQKMDDIQMEVVCSVEQNKESLEYANPNNYSLTNIIVNDMCPIGPNEELLRAVGSNNLALFKTILRSQPIDLNDVYTSTEPYTGTIIDICCKLTDKSDFVRELLLFDVDVNHCGTNEGKAPIHFAAMNRCKDVLSVLLEEPKTDINILDGDGNSALHLATMAGSVECISLLLNSSKDIKPNQLNKQGETPAYIAAVSVCKNNRLIAEFIKYVENIQTIDKCFSICFNFHF